MPNPCRRRTVVVAAALTVPLLAGTAVASATSAPAAPVPAAVKGLPLGRDDLRETRRARSVTPGVNVTTIIRGVSKARASQIATTPYGPWRITVMTIDPQRVDARLRTAIGADIARTETTSSLARAAKAIVAMNGSFFTSTRSRAYPGDPVGFTVFAGTVTSKQSGAGAEANVLLDSATMRLRLDRYTWTAAVTNRASGAKLGIDDVNTTTAVPGPCATMTDQGACRARGQVVRFTSRFAARTPPGPGVEAVLGRDGCVVRTAMTRGTVLVGAQWSLQATGAQAPALLQATRGGCLNLDERVTGRDGGRVDITPSTYGVTGRYRLVADSVNVAPPGATGFLGRNPRSILGRTRDGRVSLVTIDGRSVTSVGVTLAEAGAVARTLGLRDAVNLDGGGSTTAVVHGALANVVAGTRERAVGDAIVLVPR